MAPDAEFNCSNNCDGKPVHSTIKQDRQIHTQEDLNLAQKQVHTRNIENEPIPFVRKSKKTSLRNQPKKGGLQYCSGKAEKEYFS